MINNSSTIYKLINNIDNFQSTLLYRSKSGNNSYYRFGTELLTPVEIKNFDYSKIEFDRVYLPIPFTIKDLDLTLIDVDSPSFDLSIFDKIILQYETPNGKHLLVIDLTQLQIDYLLENKIMYVNKNNYSQIYVLLYSK